ncbi:MAG: sn-glycerol-3-phosphate ABC transporter ATP-binding protein UgpC [Betaproteobacteria bacterium]|nr:MAG: sn-glycerol-3-phosphate ABC transporter ATP-binding protein UgpC [Betaproteobacteria bacterium]
MASVQLSSVHKSFDDVSVLKDINLDVRDGEFMVFVGPSGCGKSTLLRTIAGLEEITSGTLKIGERIVNDVTPSERGIAMVFQSYALYPHMNLFDNMAFGLQLAKVPKAEIETLVRGAAKTLNIDHLLDRKPKALSGGQRQRVAIGRAIVRKPEVFLFDEPLSNLDASLRVRMRYEFAKLHEALKTTMIYVTHDQVEAMTLADRIVVLRDGRIEQVGAPLELYQHPTNQFVAGFIGSPRMNFIAAEITAVSNDSVSVKLGDGSIVRCAVSAGNAKAGDKVTLGLRPEHLSQQSGALNSITANVTFVEQLGSSTQAYCDFPGADEGVTAQFEGAAQLSSGAPIKMGFGAENCYLFSSNGNAFVRHI